MSKSIIKFRTKTQKCLFAERADQMNDQNENLKPKLKYIKLFETYHADLDKERDDLMKSGEFKVYIGKEDSIKKFFNSISDEAAPYAHRMKGKETEVKILFPKDLDIVFELKDVADMCGLMSLDVNSVEY